MPWLLHLGRDLQCLHTFPSSCHFCQGSASLRAITHTWTSPRLASPVLRRPSMTSRAQSRADASGGGSSLATDMYARTVVLLSTYKKSTDAVTFFCLKSSLLNGALESPLFSFLTLDHGRTHGRSLRTLNFSAVQQLSSHLSSVSPSVARTCQNRSHAALPWQAAQ